MFDRRTFLLAAATLPLPACIGRVAPKPRGVRVWHNMGDWAARQVLTVQALREVDADIIALQEVLEDAYKGLPNQARTLARLLGNYSVHFFSTDPQGAPRRYGNAILTRLSAIDEAARKLQPLNDYRTALRIRARIDGRPDRRRRHAPRLAGRCRVGTRPLGLPPDVMAPSGRRAADRAWRLPCPAVQ